MFFNLKKSDDVFNLVAKNAMVKPTFFDKDETIDEVIKKLQTEECDVCVVVDKNRKFIGEILDLDLIRIMAHTASNDQFTNKLNIGYKRELNWRVAKDIAKPHKNLVSLNTPMNELLKIVAKKNYSSLVVVDDDDKVLGVITSSSLLKTLSKH